MERKLTEIRPIIEIQAKGTEKILEYNWKIKESVSQLDQNISSTVKGHENDFLSAYKTIMNQIKIQMSKLRQNSDDQSQIVKNDQAVKDLQATLAWYQNEAVKLSDACSRLQTRYDRVRNKIKNYTIENGFLEQQIKMLLRQNQTLKANLTTEKTAETVKNDEKNESSLEICVFLKNLYIKKTQNKPFIRSLQVYFDHLDAELKNNIVKVDESINDIKKSIKEISSVQSNVYLKRHESEELFLECVDEMRKEVIRKKAKTCSLKRSGYAKHENLLISEREKLIEIFVTNEETISFLYEKLFSRKNNKIDVEIGSTIGFAASSKTGEKTLKKSVKTPSRVQGIVVKGKLMINR
jgi:hypothetical protein